MKVKIKPNSKYDIKFKASKAQLSVDMYFLFDLSNTMRNVLKDLAQIADDLAEKIGEVTTDRQFGFGIFREKPTPPFDIYRDAVHDFEHHLSLTSNTDALVKAVTDTVNIVGNIDNQEASLDALMQVLLCSEDIGWRPGTTHIIVMVTDAAPHTAGDGIMGATWKPYDHKCKLQRQGNMSVYPSLENDYPSFGSILYEMKKREKYLVIGTREYLKGFYKTITNSGALEGQVGTFDTGGRGGKGDLKSLILNTYYDIKDKLVVTANQNSDDIKVRLKSNENTCRKMEGSLLEIACNNIAVDRKVNIIAEVTLNDSVCLNPQKDLKVQIKVFGQKDSTLNVMIEPICECGCMKVPDQTRPDSECKGRGQVKCGTCVCTDEYYGNSCECEREGNKFGETNDDLACKAPNGQVCSTHGECQCAQCSCSSPFFGKFCECNQHECDCGTHGDCVCENGNEKCQCQSGWDFDDNGLCECSLTEKSNCIDPFTDTECNNNGQCRCNQCKCEGHEGYYCQKSQAASYQDIQRRTCEQLGPCILVDAFQHILTKPEDQPLLADMIKECEETKIKEKERYQCFWTLAENSNPDIALNTVPAGYTPDCLFDAQPSELVSLNECSAEFKGCKFSFWHDSDEGIDSYTNANLQEKIRIYFQYFNKTEDFKNNGDIDLDYTITAVLCPSFIDKWVVIGSVAGSILFIFILCFVAYIVLVNLYDKWEYERFKRDAAQAFQVGKVVNNAALRDNRKSTFGDKVRNRMSRISVRP